ncbi:MAG: AEC family transporter [Planctomycetota bacterium]
MISPLAPLVLAVAAGYALLRWGFYDDAFRRGLDKLVYWVCLPALIVELLWTGEADPRSAGLASAALCAGAVLVAGLSLVVGRLAGLGPAAAATLAQAGFRGNLAFVGLPVIVLASPESAGLAAVTFGPLVVIYNLLAVPMLVRGGRQDGAGRGLRSLLKPMVTNPLIWSCAIGLAGALSGVALPDWTSDALRLVGSPAAPLALLSVGGAMAVFPVRGRAGAALLATALKTVACPFISVGLGAAMGLGPAELRVVAVLAATPTAVASYVLVTQLKGDAALAASAVILSTLASVVSLAAALAWTA